LYTLAATSALSLRRFGVVAAACYACAVSYSSSSSLILPPLPSQAATV